MAIKNLDRLTPEQEAVLEQVFEEYDRAIENPRDPDLPTIKAWLEVVYGLYDLPAPARVEIVPSPFAAFTLAKELMGEDETQLELDWSGVYDSGWVAFYDAFHRIGVDCGDEIKPVLALREFMRCAWDTLCLDECAIIVALPKVKRDAQGNLHCQNGPALEWRDGRTEFSWHGVWVPERVVMDPRSYTKDEYRALNTEERRALGEAAGWDHLTALLGAQPVDSWADPETGLQYDLLASDEERWLKKQSPALQDGRQPVYVEPVHEELQTAQAARKWQATRLTVAECERDPALSYGVEA